MAKAQWVIRNDSEYVRKDGTTYTHTSYFEGTTLNLFNAFGAKDKAKRYPTKTVCEVAIRNLFGRRKGYMAEKV